MRLISDK